MALPIHPDGEVTGMGTSCEVAPAYRYEDHAAEAGTTVPFEQECLSVRDDAGEIVGSVWTYRSRFGYVVDTGPDNDDDGHPDTAIVVRPFFGDDLGVIDFAYRRMLAESAQAYVDLYAAATPRETGWYRAVADPGGNIGLIMSVAVPGLDDSVDWSNPVPSTDPRVDSWIPSQDWSTVEGVAWANIDGDGLELPWVLNPMGDFVQNSNGSPTWGTEPMGQVGSMPDYVDRRGSPTLRDLRMRELLIDATGLDLAGVEEVAADLRVSQAPELIAALRCHIMENSVDLDEWGDGGTLLAQWLDWTGYEARPDSTAMTAMFLADYFGDLNYPSAGHCSSDAEFTEVATLLRDRIAPYMQTTYASQSDPLRVPWGYVNTAEIAGREVGLPGASGRLVTLLVSGFEFDESTGRAKPEGRRGSYLTQAVEYSPGLRTSILPPHGQISATTHPASPHLGQTIDDFAELRFREVPTDRAVVEAELCPWGDPDSPDYRPEHEHASVTTLTWPRP